MLDESWFYTRKDQSINPPKKKLEIKKAITHVGPDPAALTPSDMPKKKRRLPVS